MMTHASNQRAIQQKMRNASAFPDEYGTVLQTVTQALAIGTVAALEERPQYRAVFACCLDKGRKESRKEGR